MLDQEGSRRDVRINCKADGGVGRFWWRKDQAGRESCARLVVVYAVKAL